MNPDLIEIRKLTCKCKIGVSEEERSTPQTLHVDIDLLIDLLEASSTDNLSLTVDYVAVCDLIENLASERSFCLIEAFAEEACHRILRIEKVGQVRIRVSKYPSQLKDRVDNVSVELWRPRIENR